MMNTMLAERCVLGAAFRPVVLLPGLQGRTWPAVPPGDIHICPSPCWSLGPDELTPATEKPEESRKRQSKSLPFLKGLFFCLFFPPSTTNLTFPRSSQTLLLVADRPSMHVPTSQERGISGRALVEVTPPLSQYVFSFHLRYSHQRLPSLPDVLCFAVPLVQLHGH